MKVYPPEEDIIRVQNFKMVMANSLANYQITIPIISTKITDEKLFQVVSTIEI